MYLTARLIGVITYCVLLFSTCLLLLKAKNPSKTRWVLFVYLLALVAMGYFYVPESGADLVRLLQRSAGFTSRSFNDLLYFLPRTNTPGATLYFYFVGLFNNPHLLPALSAFIDFALLFSIFNSELKRASVPGMYIASVLFLFMSSNCLMDSISGIRNMMACCIIVWCVYREYALKKNFLMHIPLYVLAASMHSLGQVLFMYRIVFFCFERTSFLGRVFKVVVSAALLVFIFLYGQSFLNGILDKGNSYYTSAEEGTGFFYIWGTVSCAIEWLLALYEITLFAKIKKTIQTTSPDNPLFNLMRFLIPVIIGAPIGAIFSAVFFTRLMMFAYILLIPVTLMLIEALPNGKKRTNFRLNLFLMNIVMLGLCGSRGYLCSLKFFR